MLSVLIPVYNIDCSALIKSLLEQLQDTVAYEIICIDDASTVKLNYPDSLKNHPNVKMISQEVNLGRSMIRNLLVEKASYDWFLFLDADTLPVSSNFIKNYIEATKEQQKIYFGGIKYRAEDINAHNHLRYKYGTERESLSLEVRQKSPYLTMLLSNTLIHKSVFESVKLHKNILKYGHEDAVFSHDLCKKGFEIKHIDNPVFHTGVETNAVFMEKTKVAVENLLHLYHSGIISPKANRLLKIFIRQKNTGVSYLLSFFYKMFGKRLENLNDRKNPSLFIFDMCRLSYICFLHHQKR